MLKDPGGIGGDDFAVIVLVDLDPAEFGGVRRSQLAFGAERFGVESRGCHENERGPARRYFLDQGIDPGLVGGESLLAEGVIDPVIHAVAGEDEVGFHFSESAIETLVKIGPGERMTGFRESGDAITREAEVDELEAARIETLREEGGLDHGDRVSGVGDRVSEEKDLALEWCGDRRVLCDAGRGERDERG